MSQATTWAEFRSLMPRKDYSRVVSAIDMTGEPRPRGKDEFSGDQIPGWNDGDYPTWLQLEMDGILPRKVLEKYGTLQHTFVNGSYWHLPPEHATKIVAALRAEGYVVRKADDLRFH